MTTYTTRRTQPRRWRPALLTALTLVTLWAAVAPAAAADDAPGSRTVTERHTEWQVSGPLTVLALAIAVLAVGVIVGTLVAERRRRHRHRATAA